jgi:hypothetical protein
MDVVGRNWSTAEKAKLTLFPEGDALITLTWADGAELRQYEGSSGSALSTLQRLGFSPDEAAKPICHAHRIADAIKPPPQGTTGSKPTNGQQE